jgi:hypothetical protein
MAEVIAWVVDETRESRTAGAVGGGSWIREVEAASKAEVNKGRELKLRQSLRVRFQFLPEILILISLLEPSPWLLILENLTIPFVTMLNPWDLCKKQLCIERFLCHINRVKKSKKTKNVYFSLKHPRLWVTVDPRGSCQSCARTGDSIQLLET